MFTWRKDRANISDEEPTFHVRYLGCTETYVPVGPGCTSRHVQKLWDNAPSERHLKRVTVKLGLGGIWLKGVSLKSRSGENDQKENDKNKKELQEPIEDNGNSENECVQGKNKGNKDNKKRGDQKRKESNENAGDKKTKSKSDESSMTHFKMEDVSFCAADKSANDRIFCWISRCSREARDLDESRIGPLEVHAVLCSTVDKAQTMAAVMSRAFHLAYKDWRAEQQRETRRQQTKKLPDTSSEGGDSRVKDGKTSHAEQGEFCSQTEETLSVFDYEKDQENQATPVFLDSSGAATARPLSTSSSSSSSSLSSSAMSQRSAASSKNSTGINRSCTYSDTEGRQDTLPKQEISAS
ncbi:protein FAM43A [Elysia marginata]|uniref:Protein FAM43A n=1 Tax=Elysia marginata TaxID=1093978 RepID=A0AAV4IFC5_9GAST|nr:protein FAM43A [Elysia marginata]